MRKVLGTLLAGALMFLGAGCVLLWAFRRSSIDINILVGIALVLTLFVMIAVYREPENPMLVRFIEAQEKTYAAALEELQAGQKKGCWIWWIFPQEPREGTSDTSRKYALPEAEAMAYLSHPVLGARYRECVSVVHGHLCQGGVAPLQLMGSDVDVMKLRSSLKLFQKVAARSDTIFRSQASEILKLL
jgi:uncharacterized protein (DUF1810 family)